MNSVLFIDIALSTGSNFLIVVGVEIPVPLIVLCAFEKDEIHGNPP